MSVVMGPENWSVTNESPY